MNAVTSSLPRVARAGGLERPSFADVAETELDAVYRYLLLMTGDPATAEDLVSQTFEKALRLWRRFDPARASARTWLCQIGRTIALDHFRAERRRQRREEAYARELPESEEPPFGAGLSPALSAALAELSAGEREVIALRVLLGLEGESAARFLGISQTACSTRLHRALQKLEQKVSPDVLA